MPVFLAPIAAKLATWFGGWTAKLLLVAAIIAAIGAAYWYVHRLENEVDTLTATATAAKDAAAANLAQYTDLKSKADAMAATISQLETEKAARAVTILKARDAVSKTAAVPGGDGPVAPALRAALDSLRGQP